MLDSREPVAEKRWQVPWQAAVLLAVVSGFLIAALRPDPKLPFYEEEIARAAARGLESPYEDLGEEIDTGVEGLVMIDHDRGDGHPCISYEGLGTGGGRCFLGMRAGAIEVKSIHHLLIGFAAPRTATVRVPTKAGVLEVKDFVARRGLKFFFFEKPEGILPGNSIAAYDARGRKLGNEHYNVGKGRCAYTGPYDGIMDRKWKAKESPCVKRLGLDRPLVAIY